MVFVPTDNVKLTVLARRHGHGVLLLEMVSNTAKGDL